MHKDLPGSPLTRIWILSLNHRQDHVFVRIFPGCYLVKNFLADLRIKNPLSTGGTDIVGDILYKEQSVVDTQLDFPHSRFHLFMTCETFHDVLRLLKWASHLCGIRSGLYAVTIHTGFIEQWTCNIFPCPLFPYNKQDGPYLSVGYASIISPPRMASLISFGEMRRSINFSSACRVKRCSLSFTALMMVDRSATMSVSPAIRG